MMVEMAIRRPFFNMTDKEIIDQLKRKNEAMREALENHHKHAMQSCVVYFEQDGKLIDIATDLGEAYSESALCEETSNALYSGSGKPTAGSEFVTREEYERVLKQLEPRNGHTFESLQKMWEDTHIELAKTISERDQLRAQLAAANERAEKATVDLNI